MLHKAANVKVLVFFCFGNSKSTTDGIRVSLDFLLLGLFLSENKFLHKLNQNSFPSKKVGS